MTNEHLLFVPDTDELRLNPEELQKLVNEVVANATTSLERADSEELNKLKSMDREDPADKEDDVRITLGDPIMTLDPAVWRKGARYVLANLSQKTVQCEKMLKITARKINSADQWRLASEIIAVIGPASIFAILKVDFPSTARYLSAVFALSALIVAAIARWKTRNSIHNTTHQNHLNQLAKQHGESEEIIRLLKSNIQCNSVTPEHVSLLNRANKICRRFEELLI